MRARATGAKARGAKVIATASTANQDLLKQLGTDVAVDYTKQKFEDVAKDVDVVLDSVGKDTLTRSYGVVKKGGIIVSLVARPNQSDLEKHGIRGVALSVEPNSGELAQIGKLIDEKKIRVIVSQTFPLSEAKKAQEQVASGHTRGKIVLKLAEETNLTKSFRNLERVVVIGPSEVEVGALVWARSLLVSQGALPLVEGRAV